ncbi:MAG: rhodanese-like domain-containing protein [Roseivirga sp.]|nr:rhodanese-like domain-containing protein [Roseivirga sp.]
MKIKAQDIKSLMIVVGVLLALLLVLSQKTQAQTTKSTGPIYKCTPCGCEDDDKLVHGPGNCKTCGMKLINTINPNEGLNYMNITANQLCNLIQANPDLLLLDVRSAAEFEGKVSQLGHFKNAINIPIREINQRLDELEAYKDKEILVHCSISARSPRVSKILADNGFTKIRNLMGGLNAWKNTPDSELSCKNTLFVPNQ